MEIKLQYQKIENFKGIKSMLVTYDGDNASIVAQNGVGKTTVYDNLTWLLFGKDSAGKTDSGKGAFKLRPQDQNNEPIRGLTVAAEAGLLVDGVLQVLRKESRENVIKGVVTGYTASCSINEVPKKIGEYEEYIESIIPEKTFKMLTNIRHFCGLHWKEQREMLLSLAGEIKSPKGYEKLIATLNGRTIDEYKKVLNRRKDLLIIEQNQISPRIDENQKKLENYVEKDTKDFDKVRKVITEVIVELDNKRSQILDGEKQRQKKIEALNNLKCKKIQREAELKNDTSGVKNLLDEKSKIESDVADCGREFVIAQQAVATKQIPLRGKQGELERLSGDLNDVRADYAKAEAIVIESEPTKKTCFACGQTLPVSKIDKNEQARKDKLASDELAKETMLKKHAERGKKIAASVKAVKSEIAAIEAEIVELKVVAEKVQGVLKQAQEHKKERFEEIESLIAENKTTPPEQDAEWIKICADIAKAEKAIGKPASEQLESIETERKQKEEELKTLNTVLLQADNIAKAKIRIQELDQEEKAIAQQVADIDKQLAEIQDYSDECGRLLEIAVNDKFKYVKFKLFNKMLNGETDPTCEAMLEGVPYGDMSYGQKILVGIDIINVLSEHYGSTSPLFIDNAESFTFPVEAKGQVIKLIAKDGVKTLTFSKDTKSAMETDLFAGKSKSKKSKKGDLSNVNN